MLKKINKLLIGTNNKGKFREIRALLTDKIKTFSTSDFNLKSPRENGKTFLENSLVYKDLIDSGLYDEFSKKRLGKLKREYLNEKK